MKKPHKNAKARSQLLRSMYGRMKIAEMDARASRLAKDRAEREAESANRLSHMLLGASVEQHEVIYKNQIRVCVNVDGEAFKRNPEAFRRCIMETVPRQIVDHLQKIGFPNRAGC